MDPCSRFAALGTCEVAGMLVPVASGLESRLLGLAFLAWERAGPGLLIPRCRSVHTLGMRFPLDLVFLDASGAEVRRVDGVPPGRFVAERRAVDVLELVPPSGRR